MIRKEIMKTSHEIISKNPRRIYQMIKEKKEANKGKNMRREMCDEDIKKLIKQNEIIISLLGRIAFTPDKVREIVTAKKQNPDNYIKGYNACDGKHTLSQIAKIIGVTPGTLSPILAEWEENRIIYEIEKPGGKFYKKIFPI
ncbi:MAG: hypothetical protein QXY18_01790 [Nitrososphaerota archaeon]